MEIFLIRHTTPAVERGICYGQSDIDVTETFVSEAAEIARHLPPAIEQVVSSPLRRCAKLAMLLFPSQTILWQEKLKEIDCGEWEMKKWSDIPEEISNAWMRDFVNIPFPLGENYVQLHARVTAAFDEIRHSGKTSAIIAHGGVLRSILAHITHTPLAESFNVFSLHYGCVIRVTETNSHFEWRLLHDNPPSEKETHRPAKL